MAASTPRGLNHPTPEDKIKDGSSPSALADDFAVLASSADAAITAGVQEAKDDATTKYGGLPNRVTAVEQKNIQQDTRLDGVELKNTQQDERLGTSEQKNVEQDGRLDEVESWTPTIDAGTYAIPFTDRAGFVAGGIKGDGSFRFELSPDLPDDTVHMAHLDPSTQYVQADLSHGFAFLVPDTFGAIAGGVRLDGTVQWFDQTFSQADALKIENLGTGLTRSRKDRLACVGDSLTDGYASGEEWPDEETWPGILDAKLPGTTVFNRGLRGYTVDEISIAIGALKLNLSVDGGTMPASGSVGVSTTQNIGWLMAGNYRGIRGSIAGVSGILEKDLSLTEFTFTRDTPGSSFPVEGTRVFEPEWDVHRDDSMIIFIGRNDVNMRISINGGTVEDHVMHGIERIISYLESEVKQVAVCGTITTTDETVGTVGWNMVTQINRRCELLLPGRFINVQDYMVNQAIHDIGVTPTAEDLAKMAALTLPPSIMGPGDNTHFGKPATRTLAENIIYPFLTKRGWSL